MTLWMTIIRPVEHEDKRGLGVYITDGDDEREVGRVAFVREKAKKENQKIEFADALDDVIARADKAAELINETMDEVERVTREQEHDRREREDRALEELDGKLKKAIGSAPRPNSFS